MLIPFVFELRALMDWMWTDTSMSLMEWLKMEDIFAQLFQLKVHKILILPPSHLYLVFKNVFRVHSFNIMIDSSDLSLSAKGELRLNILNLEVFAKML